MFQGKRCRAAGGQTARLLAQAQHRHADIDLGPLGDHYALLADQLVVAETLVEKASIQQHSPCLLCMRSGGIADQYLAGLQAETATVLHTLGAQFTIQAQ